MMVDINLDYQSDFNDTEDGFQVCLVDEELPTVEAFESTCETLFVCSRIPFTAPAVIAKLCIMYQA